jgi:hypothetical protein
MANRNDPSCYKQVGHETQPGHIPAFLFGLVAGSITQPLFADFLQKKVGEIKFSAFQ